MTLPPLVEPGEPLSREEVNRYSRHLLIPNVGMEGQRRIKNAKVLVIGAGGLGSPTLLYLAAAGVGTLGIIDFDRVDESNLQRQIIHTVDSIDELKVESAKRTIHKLNPYIKVETYTDRLEPDMAVELFSRYDLILDGTDNFATRYLVNDACMLADKPYVWGSIFRFEGQVSVFWENAPGGIGLNYRDLYPEPPPPELAPSCAQGGVFGVLCASIASIMSTEAIKLITGIGDPLIGRLIAYDALDMCYRELPIRRLPNRKPVTELGDYQTFCGLNPPADAMAIPVPVMTVLELKERLDQEQAPVLVDVRDPNEWEIVNIPGAILMPKSPTVAAEILAAFGPNADLVISCRSGARSRTVCEELIKLKAPKVRNLEGGVLAWVEQVAPELASY
ncbi:molybdopterin-synthase adenylyltransferase MoeB [Alcaligenes nematophilus]|uniref:Molybdopterin-synthase adenylyltransferase MoeB n=1 Tax=Alcaligenes nematophilus TaxID=2994643 RepID=A0ABU3MU36_9BURK|nr:MULTISPECIES: molybdopterin-synthase adenylyltransferase MoeB [Alcaligenes]ASC91550.1 adenylyltransferase/sulfurtransferase MoeZ [Alcaligenes faecalis]MDT8465976.1 molybdopterin-synthase adenylyltransferase MoeB [Alcaligenes nematophilus]MDT8469580.1 molybdopterin-synthase adenylyltransferase MoeB [Alcaligenes nematophilus]MDT8505274.1 molybdopterin-synthase adenylyltransferase MoeB [Alcaligenes nematophilus]MDT8524355.1 molybdopterin-synthase adenylyltransferase MoeB [Alcaligenes nematophi